MSNRMTLTRIDIENLIAEDFDSRKYIELKYLPDSIYNFLAFPYHLHITDKKKIIRMQKEVREKDNKGFKCLLMNDDDTADLFIKLFTEENYAPYSKFFDVYVVQVPMEYTPWHSCETVIKRYCKLNGFTIKE